MSCIILIPMYSININYNIQLFIKKINIYLLLSMFSGPSHCFLGQVEDTRKDFIELDCSVSGCLEFAGVGVADVFDLEKQKVTKLYPR